MNVTMVCKTVRTLLFLWLVLVSAIYADHGQLSQVFFKGPYPPMYRSAVGIKLPSVYQCMELCLTLKLCQSFVNLSSNKCVIFVEDPALVGITRYDAGGVMLAKSFLPPVITGVCQNHDCKIDEACVQTAPKYSCVKHEMSTVRCPSKAFQFRDTCVWLVNQNMTRNAAENGVCSDGSTLAEISSYEYNEIVKYLVRIRCQQTSLACPEIFWTGLEYSSKHSGLVWHSSGKILKSTDYHDFRTFPSINNRSMCLGLYQEIGKNGNWATLDCNSEGMVICQHIAPDRWV